MEPRRGTKSNPFEVGEKVRTVVIPRVMEPEKCEEWKWVPWDMPDDLFLPIRNLRATGYRPPL